MLQVPKPSRVDFEQHQKMQEGGERESFLTAVFSSHRGESRTTQGRDEMIPAFFKTCEGENEDRLDYPH